MRLIEENAVAEALTVLDSIRKDGGRSWEGWSCMHIGLHLPGTLREREALHRDVLALLDKDLHSRRGRSFICGLDEIILFCAETTEDELRKTGCRVLEMIESELGAGMAFTVFDVCRDAPLLVQACRPGVSNISFFNAERTGTES